MTTTTKTVTMDGGSQRCLSRDGQSWAVSDGTLYVYDSVAGRMTVARGLTKTVEQRRMADCTRAGCVW